MPPSSTPSPRRCMGSSRSRAYTVEDTAEEKASPATRKGPVSTMHRAMFTRMDTAPATRGVFPSCRAK